MKYLLDTNICIYLIKHKPPQVLEHFQKYAFSDIGVSAITVAELQYGVKKSHQIEKNKKALELFLLPLVIAEFDNHAASIYGDIRAELESLGKPIGALDTLIVAHALSLNITLVTNNTKEFSRIPRLAIANWTTR
ncbi:MAG: type II toxin-antitoxin system VapC family toxin [Anaerolineales bacterium]|nr:type II toxin-antitoxin system VapC family toxin [Chloroflexota bacterium]MBL6980139.1 type II toxin-antitoxin system VapC family toxin [Anaerolineales bacterium]